MGWKRTGPTIQAVRCSLQRCGAETTDAAKANDVDRGLTFGATAIVR